jgi:3-deoxy-manno-octulosonate cytidylyltransferase (CMP-KDO synthetase)
MLRVEEMTGRRVDVVMMVQGDEPLVDPRSLDECLQVMLAEWSAPVVNLMTQIQDEQDFENPNVVKVVVGINNRALYFSREPIPSRWHGLQPGAPLLKQLGLIAFRRDYLKDFSALPPGPLEAIESVDMLRVLEHGQSVRMVMTRHASIGVDTPDDLDRATSLMQADPLVGQYFSGVVRAR